MKLLWILLMMEATWLTSAQYHEISSKRFLPLEELKQDSVFGYSFAYQSYNRSLIISAPRADTIGRIYSCDIDRKNNCTVVENEVKRGNPYRYFFYPSTAKDCTKPDVSKEYKHDYWFGATVKAGSNFFVTCAPRYVEKKYGLYGEFGSCYKSTNGDQLRPLSQISTLDRNRYASLYHEGNCEMKSAKPDSIHCTLFIEEEKMDSFGWSMDIEKDDSILIGGPAMFSGRVMKIKKNAVSSTSGHEDDVNVKYNFGYSVASGNFFNRDGSYAFASPYGEDGHGKVVFFTKNWKVLPFSLKHENVGTRFGAVLAAARISSGLTGYWDDLLVGAPTYGKQHYDGGAVYYYQIVEKKRSDLTIPPKKIIVGQKKGSMFGSAIVSVGDLNNDGRDEIAIAAPYENDGKGVVYLYCGTQFLNEEKNTPWLQRIQSEDLRTFGLSLSALKDYDENGCNELAVGAPDNNTVVLYKCMASVKVDVFAKFPNLQDRSHNTTYPDKNETYFIFQSCMNVTYPKVLKDIIANIEVNVRIIHPHATLAMPHQDGKYSVSLHTKKEQYCENVGVNVPKHGNYNLKIITKIEARLLESPIERTEFDARRVLLSDLSKLTDSSSVSATECKSVEACMPKLNLTIWYSSKTNHVMSSDEPIEVRLKLNNEGEIAYDSCMTVRLEGAPLKKTPTTSCTSKSDANELKCAPTFALPTNTTWEIKEIKLDTETLTNKDKYINITARVYDHCTDLTQFKDYAEIIKLKAVSSNIVITGKTTMGELVTVTPTEITRTGKQFQQVYTITSNGYPNWVDVPYELELPKLPYIEYDNNAVVVITKSSNSVCMIRESVEREHVMVAKCSLNSITKDIGSKIQVSLKVKPNTLGDIIYKQNVTIKTELKMYFDDNTITQSVVTELMLRDVTVPWWIILIASIIGLIILFIIVLILRQCGFLKRKEKKKLENLRRSVRRQTVARSMRIQHSDDRRRLTGVPAEVEEVVPICSPGADNRIEIKETH